MSATARRPGFVRALIWPCLAMLFIGFIALGGWQVERRAWKLDLIEKVDQRVHATAVPAPDPAQWAQVNRADDEYRHVRVRGTYLHDRETLVQAVTERGSGFWVLTPLRVSADHVVLINRGFVPSDARGRAARNPNEPAGEVTVAGLLRMTEPGGGFLRHNDPAADRWYSRDVAAIGSARGLSGVAPWFIDADATVNAPNPTLPIGGLTVISFNNNHLVYAITWYALAAMVAVAAWQVFRYERRRKAERGRDED